MRLQYITIPVKKVVRPHTKKRGSPPPISDDLNFEQNFVGATYYVENYR